MKLSLSFVLASSLLSATAHAQTLDTHQALTPDKGGGDRVGSNISFISPDDLNAFEQARSLVRVTQLWNKPLNWSETGSTPEQIIAHIKESLGDQAPLIEERNASTSRSTFALQDAPLGPTLSALAELSNAKVWVLPGRLLIAPESALSPQERTSFKERKSGEWQESTVTGGRSWDPFMPLQRIVLLSVGGEIKNRLAMQGMPIPAQPVAPTPPNTTTTTRATEPLPLPYEIAFGELSSNAQQMVQELMRIQFSGSIPPNLPRLTDSTLVGFDDTGPFDMRLRLDAVQEETPKRRSITSWSTSKPRPTQ